ncbi:MAG: hypothetical protein HUU20_25480 [Pirellulales bacterium]|nr:hypothetical protein [Pirellulales bacterium]
MELPKYSVGIGDRFAHQGTAQLDAMLAAREQGVEIAPVWNKSHREHTIVGSTPADVRREADAAVASRGWTGPYFVDADHISLASVDSFLDASDFFTLDVADWIGRPAPEDDLAQFTGRHRSLVGRLEIPGVDEPVNVSEHTVLQAGRKYLLAVREAGRIFRHVAKAKGEGNFVTEVSMDETDRAQTPVDLLFILAAIADEGIPVQTIAPRFSGRFNKGIDYVGDSEQFAREFEQDLAVIRFAVERFGLPQNLKLSVHSGSDKFTLYPLMHRALKRADAGVHLKTAGTTWLEELIGLAMAGGEGLQIAKEVYRAAVGRYEELCGPYASVVDIDRSALPSPEAVDRWDEETLAAALRHDPKCARYDRNLRQLLHVAYKVAAEMGGRFTAALDRYAGIIGENVTENLYARHISPLFLEK